MWIAAYLFIGFVVCGVLFKFGAERLVQANKLGISNDERSRSTTRIRYWRAITAAFFWTAGAWLAASAFLLPISVFVLPNHDRIDPLVGVPLILAVISAVIGLFCWRAGMNSGDKVVELEQAEMAAGSGTNSRPSNT